MAPGRAVPPVSLEALRQKVLLASHSAARELASFSTLLIPHSKVHTDLWMPTINKLLKDVRKTDLDDVTDLEPILRAAVSKAKSHPGRGQQDDGSAGEVEELTQMCEVLRHFDLVAGGVRALLQEAYSEQLKKYCLSFEQEGRGLDLPILRDHENKIIRWDNKISSHLESANRAIIGVKEMRSPLSRYVTHYEHIMRHMCDVTEQLTKVTNPMRRWVSADAAYSGKIQLAISELSQQRFIGREQLRAAESERDQLALSLRRQAFNTSGVEQLLNTNREERQRLRRTEQRLTAESERLKRVARRAERAAGVVRESWEKDGVGFSRGEGNKSKEFLAAQLEAARLDLRKAEASRSRVQKEVNSIRREEVGVQHRLERAADNLKALHDQKGSALTRREQLDQEIRIRRDELQTMDAQLGALKHIWEVKVRADTVREIHQTGHVPPDLSQSQDPLELAIPVVAADLGDDWPALYFRLHFQPFRSVDERRRDVIEIEGTSLQLRDLSVRRRAARALHLWRRLSQSASLLDLTKALKSIRKKRTLQKIEREIFA